MPVDHRCFLRIRPLCVRGLDAHWEFARGWRWFATVENLFDRRYEASGAHRGNFFSGAQNSFDAGNVRAEQFRTPGAPRAIWMGIAWRPDQPAGRHAP